MGVIRTQPVVCFSARAAGWIVAVLLASSVGCVRGERSAASVGDVVPSFSLVNWDGRRISPESLRGKRTVIAFTYAKCELACPLITTQLKTLDESIGSPPDVAYLHISVNPAEDTAEEIRRHFADHGIDPEKDTRWLFARGKERDIDDLLSRFEISVQKKPVGESFLIDHTIRVWVMGADGRLVARFDTYVWDEREMTNALGS
jgi:protein SCO1/2